MDENIKKAIIYLLVIAIVAVPLFLQLGLLPIRTYDEARLAMNAIEMHESNNWLVTTFDYKPDLWNTKPPLMIWLQTICIKLFGIGEWSIRLPAALAAFATCLLLMFFSRRLLHQPEIGAIAAIVLVSSIGYVTTHGTRTGDYDALLVLFTTFASLSYFAWTENGERRNLLLFFVALTLAALTKGVAGLLFLPGLGVYSIYRKKLFPLFKNPMLYVGVMGFIAIVAAYYLLRENASPGYLQAVSDNELGGRFLQVIEEHKESFWFYLLALLAPKFVFGMPLIFLSLIFVKKVSNEVNRRLIIYLAMVSVFFWLVISSAQTKLGWYDLPLYPLMSLQVAVFIYDVVYLQFGTAIMNKGQRAKVIFIGVAFLLAVIPYITVLDRITGSTKRKNERIYYKTAYYIREQIAGRTLPDSTVYVTWLYAPHMDFYIIQANVLGIGVEHIPPDKLSYYVPTRLITEDEGIANQIKQQYKVEVVKDEQGLKVYDIR
ncbi:MAG: glycosyltransferase family 39 protein [Chitinophagales bacterium]|nr:glycosyltransferase family 39 protein [Chitinophagales bacterium]